MKLLKFIELTSETLKELEQSEDKIRDLFRRLDEIERELMIEKVAKLFTEKFAEIDN